MVKKQKSKKLKKKKKKTKISIETARKIGYLAWTLGMAITVDAFLGLLPKKRKNKGKRQINMDKKKEIMAKIEKAKKQFEEIRKALREVREDFNSTDWDMRELRNLAEDKFEDIDWDIGEAIKEAQRLEKLMGVENG